jgi:hypothetical protein
LPIKFGGKVRIAGYLSMGLIAAFMGLTFWLLLKK